MINCVISCERGDIALGNILPFLGKRIDKNCGLRYDIDSWTDRWNHYLSVLVVTLGVSV